MSRLSISRTLHTIWLRGSARNSWNCCLKELLKYHLFGTSDESHWSSAALLIQMSCRRSLTLWCTCSFLKSKVQQLQAASSCRSLYALSLPCCRLVLLWPCLIFWSTVPLLRLCLLIVQLSLSLCMIVLSAVPYRYSNTTHSFSYLGLPMNLSVCYAGPWNVRSRSSLCTTRWMRSRSSCSKVWPPVLYVWIWARQSWEIRALSDFIYRTLTWSNWPLQYRKATRTLVHRGWVPIALIP